MRSVSPISSSELWDLPFAQPQIDPTRLARAIVRQVQDNDLDFRSRLLIRDSLCALKAFWGDQPFEQWLERVPVTDRLKQISNEDLGELGFTTLSRRLMNPTSPDSIRRFLSLLGDSLQRPEEIFVGRSSALILVGKLARRTDDIDVVDEVPAALRNEQELLARLADRFGLRLAHFQSHYLPDGWQTRVRSMPDTGRLHVFLVDPIDIFVSKLLSARDRDQDDLCFLAPQLDRDTILQRIASSAQRLLAEQKFREAAERNWFIVYGERRSFQ